MKLYLPFFLLFLSNWTIQAQTPNYFENGQAWTTYNYLGPDLTGDGTGHSWNNRLYVSHDTLVGDYTYQIIKKFTRFTTSGMAGPDDFSVSTSTDIIVRQEERKIYFLTEGIDSLFTSYDLEVGDELNGYFGALNPDKIIHTIDSVLVGETYRRIFFTDTDADPFPESQLIEGIGHINGFDSGYFFSNTSYGEYWELSLFNGIRCYGEEHVKLWPGVGEECTPSLTLELEEEEGILSNIRLYPNPTTNLINISAASIIKFVRIQAIDGALLQEIEINALTGQINLTDYSKGIYIANIILADGSRIQHKLIKQ